jgi:hypothetical protein
VEAPDAGGAGVAAGEEQARSLLAAWLAVQNGGDFAGYQALYAPRFEGVRRSGTRTARLDRARWMTDRERMFEKKMTVSAKDVLVVASRDGAELRFEQTWASDTYQDVGPKHMVLTLSGGALRISREEMLRSSRVPADKLGPDAFGFVIDVPRPRLVLHDAPEDAWTAGAPRLLSTSGPTVAERNVAVDKLPAHLAAWAGRRVQLFGPSGLACEGTAARLSVVGRSEPHFGTLNRWTAAGDHAGEPRPPAAEIAQEAWGLSGGNGMLEAGRALVAEVHPEKGDCAGALWGRAEDPARPLPTLVAPADADPKTRTLALAEIRKTKHYAELQAAYEAEKEAKAPPRWEDYEPQAGSGVKVFVHPLGTLVVVSLVSGTGCGSFGGTLSAVYRLDGSALTPVREAEPRALSPVSAGDVDGDGRIDLVMREGLLRPKGDRYERFWHLEVPFYDCGC